MNNSRVSKPQYISILERIHPLILSKGLKATTMDSVARNLQISKRTLYEIFENKDDMIRKVIGHNARIKKTTIEGILADSTNSLEAFIRIFALHRDDLHRINVAFFKDMDNAYRDIKPDHNESLAKMNETVLGLIAKGIAAGLIRDDINFPVLLKMFEIQTGSLKRMEELFPPEITLIEICDTIIIGFLRSIASSKGHLLLDELIPVYYSGNQVLSIQSDDGNDQTGDNDSLPQN